MNKWRRILLGISTVIGFMSISTIGMIQNSSATVRWFGCYQNGEVCGYDESNGIITHRCAYDVCSCVNLDTNLGEGHCAYLST